MVQLCKWNLLARRFNTIGNPNIKGSTIQKIIDGVDNTATGFNCGNFLELIYM